MLAYCFTYLRTGPNGSERVRTGSNGFRTGFERVPNGSERMPEQSELPERAFLTRSENYHSSMEESTFFFLEWELLTFKRCRQ